MMTLALHPDPEKPARRGAFDPATDAASTTVNALAPRERVRGLVAARLFGDLAAPAKIGRFELIRELGAGGMGVVYAAHDPRLDRSVALKVLARASDDREAGQRLLREAQAMARLKHPNVVPVYEAGTHGDQVFIAMELVEGGTLAEWMGGRPRPWQEVLAILIPAGQGLAAAHAAGLVHRDFKPANVLIDAEGRARVSDFGLARGGALVGGDAPASQAEVTAELSGGLLEAPLTRTGAVLGTPAYMSPEQFRGDVVTPRSDLFSFCVVVWEAIFGQRPFLGESLGEVVSRIEAGRLSPPPRSIRTPHWLRKTLERGLARRPGDRFASMGELLDALGHHGHHSHRGLRGAGRTFAMASGAAMAMAFGVLLVALSGGPKGERPQDPETSAAAVAERACDETRSELEAGWSDAARASLGERLGAAGVPASPILDALDRMVADWHEVHDARCAARADDDAFVGDDLCLEDRRRDLLAAITSLGEASDAELADADGLVSMIPSVHECQLPKLTLSSVSGFGERERRADRWAKRRAIAWAFAPRAMSRAPESFEVIAERGKDQWSDKRLAVELDLAHATFLAATGEGLRRPLLVTRTEALEGMPDLRARTRALDLEALEATPHSRAHLAETWTAAYDAYRALPRRHPLREALSLDLGVLALSHAAHAGAVGCVDPARADAGCEPVRAAVELLGDRLALREDHLGADAPALVDDLLLLAAAEEGLGDGDRAAALAARARRLALRAGREAALDMEALGSPASRRGPLLDGDEGEPREVAATPVELEANRARVAITCVDDRRCRIEPSLFESALSTHARLAAGYRVTPLTIDDKRHGFKLFALRSGSVLARLGLRNGDALLEIDGVTIADPAAYDAAMAAARARGEVDLSFTRKGEARRLTLRIAGVDPA